MTVIMQQREKIKEQEQRIQQLETQLQEWESCFDGVDDSSRYTNLIISIQK